MEGRDFLVREGQRVVATGKVTKLVAFNSHAIENLKDAQKNDWPILSPEGIPEGEVGHLYLKNLLLWLDENEARLESQGILVDEILYPSTLTNNLSVTVTLFSERYCGRLTIWSSGAIESEWTTIQTGERVSGSSTASTDMTEQQAIFSSWSNEMCELERDCDKN